MQDKQGYYRQNLEGLGFAEAMMVVNNDLISNFHGLLWKHVIWVPDWKFQVFWIEPFGTYFNS